MLVRFVDYSRTVALTTKARDAHTERLASLLAITKYIEKLKMTMPSKFELTWFSRFIYAMKFVDALYDVIASTKYVLTKEGSESIARSCSSLDKMERANT